MFFVFLRSVVSTAASASDALHFCFLRLAFLHLTSCVYAFYVLQLCVLPNSFTDASVANMAERPKVKRRPLSGQNGTTPVSLYGKDSIFAPSNRHAFSLFFGRIIVVPFGTKTVLSAWYTALRHVCRLSAAQSNILIRMHPILRISVHRKKSSSPLKKTGIRF